MIPLSDLIHHPFIPLGNLDGSPPYPLLRMTAAGLGTSKRDQLGVDADGRVGDGGLLRTSTLQRLLQEQGFHRVCA